MSSIRTVVVLFLGITIGSLATWIAVLNKYELNCETSFPIVWPSSDGQWRAEQVYMECGTALGGITQAISVAKNNHSKAVRIFEASSTMRSIIFDWTSNTKLIVRYPQESIIYYKKMNVDELVIKFEAY